MHYIVQYYSTHTNVLFYNLKIRTGTIPLFYLNIRCSGMHCIYEILTDSRSYILLICFIHKLIMIPIYTTYCISASEINSCNEFSSWYSLQNVNIILVNCLTNNKIQL